jgi:hypothetical protein
MGVSTDAILFYGWDYSGEDEVQLPYELYRRAWGLQSLGVELEFHCCDPKPISFVSAHTIRAYRGTCKDVPDLNSFSTEEMNARLMEFCEKLGIKYKAPGWHLASWWG